MFRQGTCIIHEYIHTYKHTCIYTFTHAHIQKKNMRCMHPLTGQYIYIYIYIYLSIYLHCILTKIYFCCSNKHQKCAINFALYLCVCIYIYTHIYTYIHTYIRHTHTQMYLHWYRQTHSGCEQLRAIHAHIDVHISIPALGLDRHQARASDFASARGSILSPYLCNVYMYACINVSLSCRCI
jgi:hypothetical protein